MATLLKNQTAVARTLSPTTTGSGSAYLNTNEFIFYSNNPETITASSLADAGKFLGREDVKGNGQIYIWHRNEAQKAINHTILLYNANNFDVTVNVTNYGLTTTSNSIMSDVNAWESYYNGQNRTVTVPANGYANLFERIISNNWNFGIVARVNITKKNTTTAATIRMFDLAYNTNSGGASGFANIDDVKRRRGKGNGYYSTITFPTTSPTNTTGIGYSYGASANTFFHGTELPYIQDQGNACSGTLEGGFGVQFNITIPVHNGTSTSQAFRIFMGSRGGNCFPFVNYNGGIAKYNTVIEGGMKYVDIIETDIIAPGQTKNYTFSTVIPALSDAPYMVGVRCK